MARIYKKGKTSLVSSILNILGLTAAFAALYIILVQVHHDLTYNKALKDSDRIYVLTKKDINQSEYTSYLCRPMGEYVLNASPDIEVGGCGRIEGVPAKIRVSDEQSPVSGSQVALNKGAREVFGFELVAGNWADLTGEALAVSESMAKRLGVQVGEVVKNLAETKWIETTIVAIYKDMPKHSDLSSFDIVTDMPDVWLDDWKEFSFNYFLKLRKGADPKAITEVAMPVCKQFFSEMNGGIEVTDDDVKFGLYPVLLTDMYLPTKLVLCPGQVGQQNHNNHLACHRHFRGGHCFHQLHQLLLRDGAAASAQYQHAQDIGQQPFPVGDVVGGRVGADGGYRSWTGGGCGYAVQAIHLGLAD